jgi:hypothetical protein
MQGRLGLGFNAQFANANAVGGVPGVSLKYGLTRDIAAEGVVGVATSTPGNSVTGLKLFKNLFYETSLNFYFMVGGGILSASGSTAADIIGGFGAEFFIPGIESMGFSMEVGGSFTNITDTATNPTGAFVFKTFGVTPLAAGMHFYF